MSVICLDDALTIPAWNGGRRDFMTASTSMLLIVQFCY